MNNTSRSFNRKLGFRVPLLYAAFYLATVAPLFAATNDLTSLLQQGLFEEEANRNLDAALTNYQALIAQVDRNRRVAATAVFRLGECYRKLGRTNDAVAQYERIVREFADQQTLATLSGQNLAGLGATARRTADARIVDRAAEAEAEAISLKAQLAELEKMTQPQLLAAIPRNYPNPVLTSLLQQLSQGEQSLIDLGTRFKPEHPEYQATQKKLVLIKQQINDQLAATLDALKAKAETAKQAAKALRAQAGAAPAPVSPAARSGFARRPRRTAQAARTGDSTRRKETRGAAEAARRGRRWRRRPVGHGARGA